MKKAVINGLIVTVNNSNDIINNGTLVIENDKITYIGEPIDDLADFDEVIDAKGDIILPGLINTHGHTPMTLLRGFADDLPLKNWLEEKMWPAEAKFTEEHIKYGTQLAVIEMLKSGTTTFSDMYIHMDIVGNIVQESGIRANLSRSILGFGTEEQKKNKLIEAKNFTKDWNNAASGRIKTMMAPHSAYTCAPDYIEQIIQIAHDIGVSIQTHVSETRKEVDEHYARYGMSPVKHLEKIGMFDLPSLIAHTTFLNEEDIEICKNKNVKISHNPISNLKLGSGIAPIPEFIEAGLCVSLGTDSAASNNNLNLFEELRMTALLHKGVNENSKIVPASMALEMATINGAKALCMEKETGSLEIGKKADFIILDSKQTHAFPMYNPISHLVYSANGADVRHVFIDGKQVVKDRKVQFIDEQKVYSEVKRLTNQWK